MFLKFTHYAHLSLVSLSVGASLIGCGSNSRDIELAKDTSAKETDKSEKKQDPNAPVVTNSVKLPRGRTIGK